MANDNFLSFTTTATSPYGSIKVVGESQDPTHMGAIEIAAFAFGIENPTTIGSTSSGAGAGKAKFDEIDITKSVDTASPALFEAAAAGVHFPQMLLKIRKTGVANQPDYLIYDFREVFVTKIEWTGGGGGEVTEEMVTLAYGALQISYAPQNANGAYGKPQLGQWSQITDTPTLPTP